MEKGSDGRSGNTRSEQTRQKIPYKKNYGEDSVHETEKKNDSESGGDKRAKKENNQMPFGINLDILSHIDSDKILIMALLAIIYKDGGNKKLMMALAYLLM